MATAAVFRALIKTHPNPDALRQMLDAELSSVLSELAEISNTKNDAIFSYEQFLSQVLDE